MHAGLSLLRPAHMELHLTFTTTPGTLRRPWLPELADRLSASLHKEASGTRSLLILTRNNAASAGSRSRKVSGLVTLPLILSSPAVEASFPAIRDVLESGRIPGLSLSDRDEHAPLPMDDGHVSPSEELCLDFLTPLPLPCPPHALTAAHWASWIEARYMELFGGARPSLPDDNVLWLNHYANWTRTTRQDGGLSRSPAAVPGMGAHGHITGAVFLRHPTPEWLAALRAIAPYGLVPSGKRKIVEWRGQFRLRSLRGGWLDRAVLHRRRLLVAIAHRPDQKDVAPLLDARGAILAPGEAADRLLHEARTGTWNPQPSERVVILRPGSEPRIVERLQPLDRIWQQHLLRLLSPVLDRLFLPCSYGFRAGLGREDACRTVRQALGEGFVHVAKTDIERCFDSIDHAQLLARLDAALLRTDRILREVLARLIDQPIRIDGVVRPRSVGLPQGAPLSPLLANLILTALDQAMAALPVRYIRYADDIVILARSRIEVRHALARLEIAAVGIGLSLAPEKTSVTTLDAGFTFLGEHFSRNALEPVADAVHAQRKPLVVSWPWLQVGVNGPSIEIRRQGELLGRWPLRRLSALLLLAPANLSTSLVQRCASHQVAVGISAGGGRQIMIMPQFSRQHFETAHRHALWYDRLTHGSRHALAQSLVAAKLHNYRQLVSQRSPRHPLCGTLDDIHRNLGNAATLDSIRGLEGYAARQTFQWLNEQIIDPRRKDFGSRRRARGAPDPLNSLLNFGYHLLRQRIHAWVRLQGLNPYLGLLHNADDDYETLVYDLMEPFRPFVDRYVLRIINRQEVQVRHFKAVPGERRLTSAAAARFVQGFERALGERAGPYLIRDLLWVQVRAIASMIDGQGSLWVYQWHLREGHADTSGDRSLVWTLDQVVSDDICSASPGTKPALPTSPGESP